MGHTSCVFALARALVVVWLCAGLPLASAQQRIVVLSPLVGDTIDQAERAHYRLFRGVPAFRYGVTVQDSTGRFYAVIGRDAPRRDTLVSLTESAVRYYAEMIEHFDQINEGKYLLGSHPGRPTYQDGTELKVARQVESSVLSSSAGRPGALLVYDRFPFADGTVKDESERFPRFGCSIGMRWYTPAFDAVTDLLLAMETAYAQTGYPVPHQTKGISFPSYGLVFAADLQITPYLSVLLETGSTTDDMSSGWRMLSGSVLLRIPSFSDGWLRPFVGVGVAQSSVIIYSSWNYGATRISPIDTSGSYQYLNAVTVTGSSYATTPIVTGGIDFVPHFGGGQRPLSFSLMVTYLPLPDLDITTSSGTAGTVKLSDFVPTVRFSILL